MLTVARNAHAARTERWSADATKADHPDGVGRQQATLLHWAAFHGNVAMAKLLLIPHHLAGSRGRGFHSTLLGWAIHGLENGWHW